MKMEQQPTGNPQRLESTGTEKAFHILQDALDCKPSMKRGNQCPEAIQSISNGGCATRTIPHQVKEEPEDYLASHWEAHGEAEVAFNALEGKDRGDYGKVKAALLRRDAVSREKSRQHFRCFCYLEAKGPRAVYGQLQEFCHQWLKVERHTKEQILELLVLEQFLMILPPEIQNWVRQHGPETCAQAVSLAEDFLYKQQETERQANQNFSEAESVAADTEQKQRYKASKQEDESDVGPFETDVAEDPAKAGPCVVSLWTAEEIVPHCCVQEKASTNQERLECQQGTLVGGEADASVPYVGDYKAVIVATIQTGNDW
ncbi:hypothetical protein E2320_021783 [Naja naja]|nr:hypothetical protein E2320_021783 [Naja naja]